MSEMRKITINLPKDLVERATAATGTGLTETLKLGLERVLVDRAYERFRSMKGKLKVDIDLKALRED
jgi:hypothetical protein